MRRKTIQILIGVGILGAGSLSAVNAKAFMDYFQPIPIITPLLSNVWGVPTVGKRDTANGIEDVTNKNYLYWDGKIFKGADSAYHIYVSRWAESQGMNGWGAGVTVQGLSSKNVIGPYIDQGETWPDNESGKGCNTTGLTLANGTYVLLVSATRPGDLFTAASLYGPWTYQGSMKWSDTVEEATNNTTLIQQPNGDFLGLGRDGFLFQSAGSVTGPYEGVTVTTTYAQTPSGSVYATIAGSGGSGYDEDPVIWYSGGYYHIVYNYWGVRKAYHLMSQDGRTNWKYMGLAYDPTTNFVQYTDGTVNHWYNMERPGVLIENGHVTHFTFAVTDTEKQYIVNNSGHGTKVIVVPFDGVTFDNDNAGDSITEVMYRGSENKHSISVRYGAYTVNYSTNATGNAEFRFFSMDGKQLGLKHVAILQTSGSFSWQELSTLPAGLYSIYMKVNNSAPVENTFIKR
jgi:hypothetical protein